MVDDKPRQGTCRTVLGAALQPGLQTGGGRTAMTLPGRGVRTGNDCHVRDAASAAPPAPGARRVLAAYSPDARTGRSMVAVHSHGTRCRTETRGPGVPSRSTETRGPGVPSRSMEPGSLPAGRATLRSGWRATEPVGARGGSPGALWLALVNGSCNAACCAARGRCVRATIARCTATCVLHVALPRVRCAQGNH